MQGTKRPGAGTRLARHAQLNLGTRRLPEAAGCENVVTAITCRNNVAGVRINQQTSAEGCSRPWIPSPAGD